MSAYCASYAVKPPTDKTKIARAEANGIGGMRMHAPLAHARPPRARRSRRLRASSTGGMKTATPS